MVQELAEIARATGAASAEDVRKMISLSTDNPELKNPGTPITQARVKTMQCLIESAVVVSRALAPPPHAWDVRCFP